MPVYVLLHDAPEDQKEIVGVYANEEAAKNEIIKRVDWGHVAEAYSVEAHNLIYRVTY